MVSWSLEPISCHVSVQRGPPRIWLRVSLRQPWTDLKLYTFQTDLSSSLLWGRFILCVRVCICMCVTVRVSWRQPSILAEMLLNTEVISTYVFHICFRKACSTSLWMAVRCWMAMLQSWAKPYRYLQVPLGLQWEEFCAWPCRFIEHFAGGVSEAAYLSMDGSCAFNDQSIKFGTKIAKYITKKFRYETPIWVQGTSLRIV